MFSGTSNFPPQSKNIPARAPRYLKSPTGCFTRFTSDELHIQVLWFLCHPLRLSYDRQSCNHEESSERKRKLIFDVTDSQTLSLSPSPPPQPASHPAPPVPAGWTASPVAPSCPCWALIAASAWLPVLLVPTSTTTHTVGVSIIGCHVTSGCHCGGQNCVLAQIQPLGAENRKLMVAKIPAELLVLRKPR